MLRRFTLLYAGALALGLGALYAFGLDNQLIFDDARLTDGTIFGQYGSLWPFKPRLLSYGSFVWLQSMFGEGWWKQRIFNIGLHIATALALYALVLQLLRHTPWEADGETPAVAASLPWAAALAVALWAFNPVAVYAVAYLIQRSILMATLAGSARLLGLCARAGDAAATLAGAGRGLLSACRRCQRTCGDRCFAGGALVCLCQVSFLGTGAACEPGCRPGSGRRWRDSLFALRLDGRHRL